MSPRDHLIEPRGGLRDREVAEVKVTLDSREARRRGELSGEPVGHERAAGAGRQGSSLEQKRAYAAGGNNEWALSRFPTPGSPYVSRW